MYEAVTTATMTVPKYSDWQCMPFGNNDIVYTPREGQHPCWFWRKMQYLAFGVKWTKKKKENK